MMAAGGDVKANIQRWQGQFAGGDQDARKTEEMKVGKWQVHVVDVNGNYAERVGGPFAGGKVVNRENYAMVGVILEDPNGRKFFLKMIGPSEVVKANRKAFVGKRSSSTSLRITSAHDYASLRQAYYLDCCSGSS